jgi:hypothetical protein
MSEAEQFEVQDIAPPEQSFAAKVYATFRLINLEGHIAQKKIGNNRTFDYLSWAVAWDFVLQTFPESDFEFDDPKGFEGAGVEIWVTVNIREGDKVLTRRWWLPVLSFKNEPVAAPTSLQINNTRMRVLVKCLAMCGLGTELYTGEDVPDEKADAKVRGTSVVAAALEGVDVDWTQVEGHVASIKAAIFNEDNPGLFTAIEKLSSDSDLKLGVWSKLHSKDRSYIKKIVELEKLK